LVEAGFDDQAMLDRAASMMAGLIGEICVIRLLSEDGQRLALASYHHADPAQQAALDQVMASDPADAPEDLWRTIFETREPIFRPAASVEDLRRFTRLAALRLPGRRGSLIVVPLTRQSNVSGAVTLFRSSAQCPYTPEDVKLVQSLADLTALAVTNARLHRDLEASLALETSTRQQLVQAEKLSALGRMVGSVAHELNNPLQTITNCLYLTDQELTPHSPIHDYLEMAQAETQRLVDLVAQLRELYRMRPTGAPEARRLDSLLHDVRTLMAPQLTSANVEWLQPANVPDCVINVIQDRLKQVFINLAGNAIEAMQPRGGQLRIDVTPTADGRQVAVTFKDTGPGILPENLSRLFEPFFTTKAQGLGLGLSICYEIVQQHGGQITVESQPEQGAAFTVWLPLAAQDEKPEFASQ
jgi:signal transduction histidine kinase